jgi:hypothetical protein
MKPSKILVGIFFSLFIAGFAGTVIELDHSILKTITLSVKNRLFGGYEKYTGFLIIVFLGRLSSFILIYS